METINFEELKFIDDEPYKEGGYGSIKRCIIGDKTYACKAFNKKSYLKGKKRKLSLLSSVKVNGLYIPKFWVKKDNNTNMYLTDFYDGMDATFLSDENNFFKLKILKKVKQLILLMHEQGVIHADLIPPNILYSKDSSIIIDFDNSSFKNFKTRIQDANYYSNDFMKNYGIMPEIDIFLFNLLTFYVMNEERNFYNMRCKIKENDYGIFDNPYGRKICKSFFLEDKVPNKDFLIDAIDEASLKY